MPTCRTVPVLFLMHALLLFYPMFMSYLAWERVDSSAKLQHARVLACSAGGVCVPGAFTLSICTAATAVLSLSNLHPSSVFLCVSSLSRERHLPTNTRILHKITLYDKYTRCYSSCGKNKKCSRDAHNPALLGPHARNAIPYNMRSSPPFRLAYASTATTCMTCGTTRCDDTQILRLKKQSRRRRAWWDGPRYLPRTLGHFLRLEHGGELRIRLCDFFR